MVFGLQIGAQLAVKTTLVHPLSVLRDHLEVIFCQSHPGFFGDIAVRSHVSLPLVGIVGARLNFRQRKYLDLPGFQWIYVHHVVSEVIQAVFAFDVSEDGQVCSVKFVSYSFFQS